MMHDFFLSVDIDENTDKAALVDVLYEAGCSDALVLLGEPGVVTLNFIREASSFEEAVVSARANLNRVFCGRPALLSTMEDYFL